MNATDESSRADLPPTPDVDPGEPGEAVLRVLVMTDLAASTQLTSELGDRRAAVVGAAHDELARNLLRAHGGQEIDKTDGFLFVFTAAGIAARFLLAYHEGLERLSETLGVRLEARASIHGGEVILRANPPEHVARGAKPIELEGIAKPTAARLMGLALPRQTLMSRFAFDEARRTAGPDEDVHWLAHGPFLFKGLEQPIEVYEMGRAGRAPLVRPPDGEKARRALPAEEEELLGWRPAPGLRVPGRSSYRLDRKVGEGGFGEVWVARHEHTQYPLVFKFCFDAERLRGLKREITLFRVLRDTLGDRPDIARINDWNLTSPPYFIESEYAEDGSITSWAELKGGLQAVELSVRIGLVAGTGVALAAAHSVGVLHKDIKPDNVLVRTDGGSVRAILTDFGVGLLTDTRVLEQRGITSLGLPASELSISSDSPQAGTLLYLAPELMEGRAPTVQSDIYALGVLLYQLAAGDLGRALGMGWERDVPDELLREDIAACVARDPALRPNSALELSRRLLALEERRAERRSVQLRAARELRLRRTTRAALASALGAVSIATLSLLLWRRSEVHRAEAEHQRQRADQARTDAEALLTYVNGDLYETLAPLGQVKALDAVTSRALRYFEGLAPEDRGPRSLIHHGAALRHRSRVLVDLGDLAGAKRGQDEARALLAGGAVDDEDARKLELSEILEQSSEVARSLGDLARAEADARLACSLVESMSPARASEPAARLVLANGLTVLGTALHAKGAQEEALAAFHRALELVLEVRAATPGQRGLLVRLAAVQNAIAGLHEVEGRLPEAQASFESALAAAEQLVETEGSTPGALYSLSVAWSRLGSVLASRGALEEALVAHRKDLAIAERLTTLDPKNLVWLDSLGTTWNTIGSVLQERGDLAGALAAYQKTLAIKADLVARDPSNASWRRNLGVTHGWIGAIQELRGDLAGALESHRRYDELLTEVWARDRSNVEWADSALVARRRHASALFALQRVREAEALTTSGRRDFAAIAGEHPTELRAPWGRFLVLAGTISEARGDRAEAEDAFTEALSHLAAISEPNEAVRAALQRARESLDRGRRSRRTASAAGSP